MEITQLIRCLLLVAVLCCSMITARPRPEKAFDDDCVVRWTGVRCPPKIRRKTLEQKIDIAKAIGKNH